MSSAYDRSIRSIEEESERQFVTMNIKVFRKGDNITKRLKLINNEIYKYNIIRNWIENFQLKQYIYNKILWNEIMKLKKKKKLSKNRFIEDGTIIVYYDR